jgi:predicted O-methyltransferase YrrM
MKIEDIHAAVTASESSLNKHYWTLFSIAYGLQAKLAFEFGAGTSSAVLLTALELTGGKLISCDHEPLDSLVRRTPSLREYTPSSQWAYWNVDSSEALRRLNRETFDLVLHDGSHEQEQVAEDITGILPCLKRFGILLLHDVEQFQLGPQMRTGLMEGIRRTGLNVSLTSLPWSDGLAIVRMESDTGRGQVSSRWCKSTTRPALAAALPWTPMTRKRELQEA